MTVEIEMTDADFKSISNYAAENKISVAEFLLKSAIEKIEDAEWDYVSKKLITRNKKVYEALAK